MIKRPTLMMLVGLPGSGKSTWAKNYIYEHPDTAHMSSDAIRKELFGDESIQENPEKVFGLMHSRSIEALNSGKDVIYDATNMTRKDRSKIIEKCPNGVRIECHIIWEYIDICVKRDSKRERVVGEEVINRMVRRFQAPFYDEGFEGIYIHRNSYSSWNLFESMKIPHDNPHHTLGIYEHCWEAYDYIAGKTTDEDLRYAALLHDCGKPYVKSFVNNKGETTDIAHYYQHQCVGAWISYSCISVNPYTAWLISTHMDPFLNTKYYKNLPTYLKQDIDLLHEADLNAH